MNLDKVPRAMDNTLEKHDSAENSKKPFKQNGVVRPKT